MNISANLPILVVVAALSSGRGRKLKRGEDEVTFGEKGQDQNANDAIKEWSPPNKRTTSTIYETKIPVPSAKIQPFNPHLPPSMSAYLCIPFPSGSMNHHRSLRLISNNNFHPTIDTDK